MISELRKTEERHQRDRKQGAQRGSGSLWWNWEALESTTTTPQIKNLIGRMMRNKRAARAPRNFEQVRAVFFKTKCQLK